MASSRLSTLRGAVNNLVARQVSQSDDQNIGSSTTSSTNNPSASQLLATLIPVFLVAVVWLGIFIIFRPKNSWKYSPRSQSKLLSKNAYTPYLPNGRFNWLPKLWAIPDTYVLTHQSLDSYLFLRFLRLGVVVCLVGCVITFPILFPVYATGGAGQMELNVISMSNVVSPWRFFATAILAWIFFGFIMFLIARETVFYINLRQAYLMNPAYSSKLSARTVLFTSVPEDYLNEEAMRFMLGDAVTRVWFPTDDSDLSDMVDERDEIAYKLEGAESKLIKSANDARLKALKKNKGDAAAVATHNGHQEDGKDAETASGSVAAKYISPKDRPTHRLKFLIGKKVDTIDWCRNELQTLMPKVDAEQEKHRNKDAKRIRAVFVEFKNLREAQAAYQSLTHHQALVMAPRFTGMHPSDVIWKNLRIKGVERYVRFALSTAFVCALIVFWSIPVAVVGAISNITFLIKLLPWLSFINNLPSALLGVITGLLPSVMLAALMAVLPIILRLAAVLGGAPTHSDAEYTLQNSYFAFQIIQVFIITTLASAASAAIQQIIANPASVTELLSTSLPKASNFFLSYIILLGLGSVASQLVGVAGLIVTPLLVKILGSTPRKIFQRWNQLSKVSWGTLYPIYTNMLVIAICYSCIAPLVMLFAAIGLFLFYFAFRYNFLFVNDTGVDQKGLGYARALRHLFVGLYIAEICLLGLFATRLSSVAAIGPFVLMILLIIFTALFQVSLKAAVGPLLTYLPKTLEAEESKALLAQRNDSKETNGYHNEDVDGAERGYPVNTNPDKKSALILDGPPHKKPNMLTKFLKPHIYNDYATMRRLVPTTLAEDSGEVDQDLVRSAYLPPSTWREMPTIMLPRDEMGVSTQEVRDSSKAGIPIRDDAGHFNDKGKIVVDDDVMSEVFFESREQRLKNAPGLSSSLIG